MSRTWSCACNAPHEAECVCAPDEPVQFSGETVWSAFIENHAMDIQEEALLMAACERHGEEWPPYARLQQLFDAEIAPRRLSE